MKLRKTLVYLLSKGLKQDLILLTAKERDSVS